MQGAASGLALLYLWNRQNGKKRVAKRAGTDATLRRAVTQDASLCQDRSIEGEKKKMRKEEHFPSATQPITTNIGMALFPNTFPCRGGLSTCVRAK